MLNGRCTMGLVHDITFSFRLLWKNRGFAAAAILILALAIGANSTIFTLVNSILLRQLPFGNSDGLVWIWSTRTDRDKAFFSIPNLIDTREQATTLSAIAAFANWGANLTESGEAERLQGVGFPQMPSRCWVFRQRWEEHCSHPLVLPAASEPSFWRTVCGKGALEAIAPWW